MIVRILGEGQLDVPDEALAGLNQVDRQIVDAVDREYDNAFDRLLAELLDHARRSGTSVPADHLGPSDLILPDRNATRTEVVSMLAGDGLIPGA